MIIVMKAQHRLRIAHRSLLLCRAEGHVSSTSSSWQVMGFEKASSLGKKRSKSSSSSKPIPAASPASSSSSSFNTTNPLSMVDKAIKERVKNTFLQEAVREDSRIWQENQPHVNGESTTVNGSGRHYQKQQQQQHPQHKTIVVPSAENEMNRFGSPSSSSASRTKSSSYSEQPLSDLLLLDTEQQYPLRYWPDLPPTVQPRSASNDPFLLTKSEIQDLSRSIRDDLIIGNNVKDYQSSVLNQAASYFFNDDNNVEGSGGKKFRPIMVLLLSRVLSVATATGTATASNSNSSLFGQVHDWQRPDLPYAQRRLAQVIEMIHAASLFHDDVIDKAATRRGRPSVHMVFGNKIAILAGDYLVGRTSVVLARLRNDDVFEVMSTIIEHLVRGEVMQMAKTTTTIDNSSFGSTTNSQINGGNGSTSNDPYTQRLLYYLRKNFYKTGSLMAHTCRSAAMLGNYSDQLVEASYRYGKHMGMAFQLVDDVLDFSGSGSQVEQHLGKPAAFSDLRAGVVTAPILFAAQENPHVWQPLLDRQFSNVGDVDLAVSLLESSNGMERTKHLARAHAEKAMDAILEISSSSCSNSNNNNNNCYRDALIHLASDVVSRTK